MYIIFLAHMLISYRSTNNFKVFNQLNLQILQILGICLMNFYLFLFAIYLILTYIIIAHIINILLYNLYSRMIPFWSYNIKNIHKLSSARSSLS